MLCFKSIAQMRRFGCVARNLAKGLWLTRARRCFWIPTAIEFSSVSQGQSCACTHRHTHTHARPHTKAVISTGVINGRAERNAAGASGSYRLIQTLA